MFHTTLRRLSPAYVAFLGATLLVGACTERTAPDPPVLTSLAVSVSAPTVAVGQSVTATAAGADQNGDAITAGTITWTSTTAATVDASGKATGVAPGTATITATALGVSGQATLTVTALPAVGLKFVVAPSSAAASRVPMAQQPSVQLVNAVGGNVAQSGVVVTATASAGGTSSGATAATNASGLATFTDLSVGGSVGNYAVTYAAPGLTPLTNSLALTFGAPTRVQLAAGDQQQAIVGTAVPVTPSVKVTDADGNPVAGVPVIFDVPSGGGTVLGSPASTNTAGVAAVTSWILGSAGPNSLLAHLAGNPFGVTFTANGVLPPPVLTTILVALDRSSAVAGSQVQASATGRDQYGASIALPAVTWSANGPVSISPAGTVQALAPGQATIIAAAGGKTGQATLSVSARPVLSSLTVALGSSSIAAGGTTQATVTGKDQFGENMPLGVVAWTAVGNATVSASGIVTGTNPGPASIRASALGVTAQAELTVTGTAPVSPVLTTLFIQLTPSTLPVGGTAQALVSGADQFGLPMATGPVVWSATGAATISQSGIVTGTAPGTAAITATAGAVSAQITTSVTPVVQPPVPMLTSITVAISPGTIPVGGNAQATASGKDQFGASIPTGPITWSGPPQVSINSAGVITGVSVGQAQVKATAGAVSGFGYVEVSDAPRLAQLLVTISPSSIGIGSTSQTSVVGRDQYGNPFSPGTLAYYVSAGASITQQGLIVGQTAGQVTVTVQNTATGTIGTAILTVTGSPSNVRLLANSPPAIPVPNRNTFTPQPSIQLIDGTSGQPVAQPGVVITASLTRAVGTLFGTTSLVTDATGKASWSDLGVIAQRTSGAIITFSAPGFQPTNWTFNITGGSVGTEIRKVAGDNQTVPAGWRVLEVPQIAVLDPEGNPISVQVPVSFAVTAGGGSIAGAPTVTNNGLAALTEWRLGAVGTNSVTVTAQGVQGSAVFNASATAPLPCAPPVLLTIGQQTFGRLMHTGCVLRANAQTFTGPQIDAYVDYDAYEIDIPAGAAVRFDFTYDFGPSQWPTFAVIEPSGAYVAAIRADSPTPLGVVNSKSSTVRYTVLVRRDTGMYTGGFYSITPVRTN